jgi:hypothetical protein
LKPPSEPNPHQGVPARLQCIEFAIADLDLEGIEAGINANVMFLIGSLLPIFWLIGTLLPCRR